MTLRISVIGTNYLGATHAAGMAEFGHQVIGVDIDADRVKRLNAGQSPIYEANLEPILQRHLKNGRLRFSTDYAEIADWADVHFICVGTPESASGAADLSQVWAVRDLLAPYLTRPTLIVGKSTAPVGTAAELRDGMRDRSPAAEGIDVIWNPEFLRESFAVEDTLRPDRIVLGIEDERSLSIMQQVYAIPITEDTPFVVCNFATAELIKSAANAFLATKISFINAMAQMCQATGGDVGQLADALGHDSRIGREFLNAGLGYGGGCIPKDIRSLAHRADELGVSVLTNLIGSIEEINDGQRVEVAELAVDQLGGNVAGKRVAVLGAAFKPGTDDTRNSPALTVADHLHAMGAEVLIFDPEARLPSRDHFTQVESVIEAVRDADICLHLTEWPQFRYLDPEPLAAVARNRVIIDARLKLDPEPWRAAGWKVVQLGRAATL